MYTQDVTSTPACSTLLLPSDFSGDALATATALQDHLADAVDDQETANRSIAASNSLVAALERDANQVRCPGGERGDGLVGLSLTTHCLCCWVIDSVFVGLGALRSVAADCA